MLIAMLPTSYPSMGYDRAITVFSPDGRLFQVEYAREAVKRGTTSLGIRYKDGVLLAADKRLWSRLVEAKSIEKIFQIDEAIGSAASGLVADARVIIDWARVEAQNYFLTYNEAIDVRTLAKRIGNFQQLYTQFGGVRPFGVSLLIAGIENKPRLFETDPSGAVIESKASAIGAGRTRAMEIFEEKYSEKMSLQEALELAMKIMNEVMEGKLSEENVEISTVDAKAKEFRMLEKEEVKNYISKIKK